MAAYYNENDPGAAAWLRELIKRGLIADGEVDERSILDVTPADLAGLDQCHFFAGIGGWSYALRLAGWPDDLPVWTGSAPCQPFSAAGKRAGFADERHLWPAFHWLISQCRPDTVFGEQVAGKPAMEWLDHVSTDLEGEGYAVGQIVFPACGIGAPHLRQRLYWVAESDMQHKQSAEPHTTGDRNSSGVRWADGMANSSSARLARRAQQSAREECPSAERGSDVCSVAHTDGERRNREHALLRAETPGRDATALPEATGSGEPDSQQPGPVNGFWSDADWLRCTDDKWRAVEPGSQPLASGLPARVVRLRGYGNAIVAPQAAEFIKAVMSQ